MTISLLVSPLDVNGTRRRGAFPPKYGMPRVGAVVRFPQARDTPRVNGVSLPLPSPLLGLLSPLLGQLGLP